MPAAWEIAVEQMLRETGGKSVTCGGQSTYGHFQVEDLTVLDEGGIGGTIVGEPSLVIPTGSLPGLMRGSTVVIDGQTWRVREPPQRMEDGAMSRVWLERGGA